MLKVFVWLHTVEIEGGEGGIFVWVYISVDHAHGDQEQKTNEEVGQAHVGDLV